MQALIATKSCCSRPSGAHQAARHAENISWIVDFHGIASGRAEATRASEPLTYPYLIRQSVGRYGWRGLAGRRTACNLRVPGSPAPALPGAPGSPARPGRLRMHAAQSAAGAYSGPGGRGAAGPGGAMAAGSAQPEPSGRSARAGGSDARAVSASPHVREVRPEPAPGWCWGTTLQQFCLSLIWSFVHVSIDSRPY